MPIFKSFRRGLFVSVCFFSFSLFSLNGRASDDQSTSDSDSRASSRPYIRQTGASQRGEFDVTPFIGSIPGRGFSLGVLGGYRFVQSGFISTLNNSVSAEAGLTLGNSCLSSRCHDVFIVSGNMRWDFHVHPKWTVYGAPGLALGTASSLDSSSVRTGLFLDPKVGAFFWLSKRNALRFEHDVNFESHRVGITLLI
ncbi:MAG: hypothetical protein NTV34_13780 [Proteobacteria bacterium]|nr:hypothetical protein [Pseudomonadota bacterium]